MARSANDYYNEFDREAQDDGKRSLTEQIDFQHYLRILRKHKLPIVLFTAIVTALGFFYAKTATPIYEAKSTLLIESQKANVVSIEELVGLDSETREYYETQYSLLASRRIAERVINHLNMWHDPELRPRVAIANEGGEGSAENAQTIEPQGVAGKIRSMLVSAGIVDEAVPEDSAVATTSPDTGATGLDTSAVSERSGSVSAGADESATEESPFVFKMEDGVRQDQIPEFKISYAEDDTNYLPRTEEELIRAQVVSRFMSKLSISPVRGTKLVEIGYESEDAVVSARVANAVGDQYIESYLDARMEMTTKASEWLTGRLQSLKAEMDSTEDRLITFKQENGLVDVGGSVGRLNEQELLLATTELAQARSELASASDLYNEVSSLKGNRDLLESIVAVQGDPLVQQVKIEQGQRQRELDELLNRYGERHPRVVDAKSRLASLEVTLASHVSRIIGSIQKDYQLLAQRVAGIEAKLSTGKQNIQSLGSKTFELEALERELATKRNIYDTFFNRMAETSSANGLEAANARITEFAIPPLGPIKPNKQLIIALAALGSLVLSILMVLLYEQMDETVKGTHDIEEKLGVKILGIMPLLKSGGLLNRPITRPLNPVMIKENLDKNGTFGEAVDTIRTSLLLDDKGGDRKVILVTSSVPGEGKSTACINLAYSMAQMERVLLIDCDMRRPTIAAASGLGKNVVGLSSLITGSAIAKDCIRQRMFGGIVDILPSGPAPEQPLELLSSRRFEKIVEKLKLHYDRIILDCAPTQAVSDALVLSGLSDAVVFIIKSHETRFDLVKRGIERLRHVGSPIAGAVITQVDVEKIANYGGDVYYQGYYDYYGYNSKNSDQSTEGKFRLTPQEIMDLKTDDSDVDLGLDYGLDSARGVSRNPAVSDKISDHEFDRTARFERNPSNEKRDSDDSSSTMSMRLRKAQDDLDII